VIDMTAGAAAVVAARTMALEFTLPLSVAGVNDALTPAGRPSAESCTSPVKFVRVSVAVSGVLAPCTMVAELADSPTAIEPGTVGLSLLEHAASAAVATISNVRRGVAGVSIRLPHEDVTPLDAVVRSITRREGS
jgi:hypothetical protein